MWLVSPPSLFTAVERGSQWVVGTKELKPGEEGGGRTLVCMEAGDVGGPEAAKIFFQTSASAFENRSRKILAVACELNDVTAALNIYVIKGCHQLGTEPSRGCFSPAFIFIFRKWAGLFSYTRGIQGTSEPPCGKGPLEPGIRWGHRILTIPGKALGNRHCYLRPLSLVPLS